MQKYLNSALRNANMIHLHHLYSSKIYLKSAKHSILDSGESDAEGDKQWKLLLLVTYCVLTCGLVTFFFFLNLILFLKNEMVVEDC